MTTARASSWYSWSMPGDRPTKRPLTDVSDCLRFFLLKLTGGPAWSSPGRELDRLGEESGDADERGLSRARRLARNDPRVSPAGGVAAAARANAAQYFRAALSRHGGRLAARRPPADWNG